MSEIGCDLVSVSAARDFDGTVHLLKIDVTAPDEFLTGTGQIAPVKGLALTKRPLSLDIRFGARASIAKLMRTAEIVGTAKDNKGFAVVPQLLHFGGTLEQVDAAAWHDLLAKAATQPAPKKP